MLNLSNITKSYDKGKKVVLQDLSLFVKKGDFIAIMGDSGSGKTTLLNIISTIDMPSSGIFTFNKESIHTYSSNQLARFRNEHIGVVFQNYNLLPEYTVKENILLPRHFMDKVKNIKDNYDLLVEELGIEDLLNKKAKTLSGGEQQRVSVARAMINYPDIILADEPTGNLDNTNSDNLFDMLKALNDQRVTVIVVTHNQIFANRFNKVFILENGKLTLQKKSINK